MDQHIQNLEHISQLLKNLEIPQVLPFYSTGQKSFQSTSGEKKSIHSPIDGSPLADAYYADELAYEALIQEAQQAFPIWRKMPPPQRGEIIRQVGEELRKSKEDLGKLVSLEMGKILQEGLGEVQEMIDICDFAVGLSRQLYGLTMTSERPEHRMFEQYHPLGLVGIISAFNFPVAVWSWNAMIAAICGNVCIWKPSEKTPITAIACQNIVARVLKRNDLPEGIFNVIIGDARVGQMMTQDDRIPLISATGSIAMGKKVAETVGKRLGKVLLELGGNNAVIISQHANLEMAIRATLFGAVGTCGQRCTTTRRLIVHESIYDQVRDKLLAVYPKLPIGNPMEEGTLIGPLIDQLAVASYKQALNSVQEEGGKILYGGEVLSGSELYEKGNYVLPTLVEADNSYATVQDETFAPILYLMKYSGDINDAIDIQNGVRQGLSSAIFSNNLLETESFLSYRGSDCGIANVNIGTSGAEIGGAFGGEKETGGGRESGSDAWKVYMRRQTNTVNYGSALPLAQGIKFDVEI